MRPPAIRWKRGTLHGGKLDAETVLLRFHKKGMKLDTLRIKISQYVEAGAMDQDQAERVLTYIESQRGVHREGNRIGDTGLVVADDATGGTKQGAMTRAQLDSWNGVGK